MNYRRRFPWFYEKQNELKIDMVAAIKVKIDASLGLHILRKTAEIKENLW